VSDLWLLMILCTLGTYAWRGLGVLLGGRLEPDSDLFRWVSCVAYAMIAGLVMRLIVMPTGPLAGSLFWHRMLACLLGLAIYRGLKGNVFLAVGSGAAALAIMNELRGFVA
jgi:branched-subunit amino acid transport protein